MKKLRIVLNGSIRETIEDIGLPESIINIVLHCISTSSMKVLWNGEAPDGFRSSRGIK